MLMIRSKDTENTLILMADRIKVTGIMENNMEKELLLLLKVNKKMEFGKMEKGLDG